MKVLFVSRDHNGVSPIVSAQAASLSAIGIEVEFFPITGKGIWGYISAIPQLGSFLRTQDFDVVHAHYSLCGIVAYLASAKPVVMSLMGSDVLQSGLLRAVIRFFVRHLWRKTIVKSDNMKQSLGLDELVVLPNGVNLDLFIPMDRNDCRLKLGWGAKGKHILFVSGSNPDRYEKNLQLAQEAVMGCSDKSIELHVISNVKQSEMPVYLNAANLLLLTSRWEGSPNIVKEAMACNCPVVATDVGDVRWLLEGVKNCEVIASEPNEAAEKIKKVLDANGLSDGRDKILKLGIDAVSIARKLTEIYKSLTT